MLDGMFIDIVQHKLRVMKILIVDDSTINNMLLQDILEAEGYEVYSALNGKEALQVLETHSPGMILLDLMMPEINGFDLLKKLREEKLNIPVIVISAYNSEDYIKKAMELGALDYMLKPVKGMELIKRIEHCVA